MKDQVTTEQDFLNAIIANPTSDEERLIFTDYLEENGQHLRSEFIKTQIELAKGPNGLRCKEIYGWQGTKDENSPEGSLPYTYYQGYALLESGEVGKFDKVTREQEVTVCCWTRLSQSLARPYWIEAVGKIKSTRTMDNGDIALYMHKATPLTRWRPDLYKLERAILHNQSFDLYPAWASKLDWSMTTHAHEPKFRVGIKEGIQDIWCTLKRGFIEDIECTIKDWEYYGPEIVSTSPIANVKITDVKPSTTDREPGFRDFYCWEPRWPCRIHFLADHLKFGHDSWRDTEEECNKDLSKALITWAKDELKRGNNGK